MGNLGLPTVTPSPSIRRWPRSPLPTPVFIPCKLPTKENPFPGHRTVSDCPLWDAARKSLLIFSRNPKMESVPSAGLSVARVACLTPISKKYANWIRKSAGMTADGWNNTSPRFAKLRSVPSEPMPGWISPDPKSPRQTVSEPTGMYPRHRQANISVPSMT